jgi:hypothetical protein
MANDHKPSQNSSIHHWKSENDKRRAVSLILYERRLVHAREIKYPLKTGC